MADGTDELQDLEAELDPDSEAAPTADLQDEEASAAIQEAQSVVENVESTAVSDLDAADHQSATDRRTTPETDDADADSSSGLLPSFSLPTLSLPSPGSLFSTRSFVVSVVAAVVGAVAGGLIPVVGGVVSAGIGIAGTAFVLGLLRGNRHYLENGLAGAGVLGTLALLGRLEIAVATGGSLLRLGAFGAGVGLLAALVGTYFGRDLRKGLFGSIDDRVSGP